MSEWLSRSMLGEANTLSKQGLHSHIPCPFPRPLWGWGRARFDPSARDARGLESDWCYLRTSAPGLERPSRLTVGMHEQAACDLEFVIRILLCSSEILNLLMSVSMSRSETLTVLTKVGRR
jgi:hypothetical protein